MGENLPTDSDSHSQELSHFLYFAHLYPLSSPGLSTLSDSHTVLAEASPIQQP